MKSQAQANALRVVWKSIWCISSQGLNPPVFLFVASLIQVFSLILAQQRWEFCTLVSVGLFAERAAPGHKWSDGNGPKCAKMWKTIMCGVLTRLLQFELKESFHCSDCSVPAPPTLKGKIFRLNVCVGQFSCCSLYCRNLNTPVGSFCVPH